MNLLDNKVKNYFKKQKHFLFPQMPKQRDNLSNTMKNQDNKAVQKENEKSPVNKDANECDLNDIEPKIPVLKNLNKIQEKAEVISTNSETASMNKENTSLKKMKQEKRTKQNL